MKALAITLGDPAGIGGEVVLKALDQLEIPVRLFGSRTATERAGRLPANVQFVDAGELRDFNFGEVSADAGRVALASIDAAVAAIERGECSALVTAPIHKQSIALAGATFPGHTELLASRAGLHRYGHDYAMYFDSPSIKTVLLSVHVPLIDAIRSIDSDTIAALAELMSRSYRKLYSKPPRIAVAGINPHAGEGGRFGREEELIARGVQQAQEQGIDATGPLPADTVFLGARNGKYDVIISMYHDQGLIAVKTLDFERSVNVTIGLPYLRASVDHGTAFDIAGRGMADARPMRYAIEWTARNAERWTE